MVRLIGVALVLTASGMAILGFTLLREIEMCCTLLQTIAVWIYWDIVMALAVGGALLIRRRSR
jgi:hypothetical protein